MKTIEQFIEESQLEMKAKSIPGRKDIPNDSWSKNARHFVCQIDRVGFGHRDPMIVYFSQGSAHKKPPTLSDVLDCLAADCASIDCRAFDEWSNEMGYTCQECEQPTKNAERIYFTIEEQADDLRRLLDVEKYNELLWDVERL